MRIVTYALLCAGALCFTTPAFAQQSDSYAATDGAEAAVEPAPPPGAAPNQYVPARDAAGRYLTPNIDLSAEETVWHVRAALNVAALSCRDDASELTIAAYNAMLRQHSAPLAAADAAVHAQDRARFGADWERRHETAMTRLYNFFAQPPAQAGFCAVARDVLAEAANIDAAQFTDFAARALPRLEAPFLDFYRVYDSYRTALADWRATRSVSAPPAVLAAASGSVIPLFGGQ